MEPRKDEQKKIPEPRKEAKQSRFHIDKLEDRIAPSCNPFDPGKGGKGKGKGKGKG
jgi:hypothetical protein